MTRPLIQRVLIMLLMTAYVLVIGEAFVRLFAPALIMPRFVGASVYGVRQNIPLSQYWHYTPEVAVEYRINRQGFRADRDYSTVKPPGVCRILLFGDSFFMGYEVDLSDSFAAQLEVMIRAAGFSCEVINMAVSGFGTAEMLVALQSNGLRFSPDLVIFQLHKTDPDDNLRSDLFSLEPDGSLIRRNQEYLPAVRLRSVLDEIAPYRWLEQHSQLFGSLRERAGAIAKRRLVRSKKQNVGATETELNEHTGSYGATTPPYRIALTRALLMDAAKESQQHNAAFMIFEVPTADSRTQFRSVDPRLISSLPSEIVVASPLALFQRYARPDTLIYHEKGAGHWSPLGNRLAAMAAAEAIISGGLLQDERMRDRNVDTRLTRPTPRLVQHARQQPVSEH